MKGSTAVLLVAMGMVAAMATLTSGATIGIDVGLQGNDLPPLNEIVQLLNSRGVTKVRIYDAARSVLTAFQGSGIHVSVAVPNDALLRIANSQQAATDWIQTNVQPFLDFIDRIVVGNEWLHNPNNDPSQLLPAMENIHNALTSLGLSKKITTPHAFDVDGYPPSEGTFRNPDLMRSILAFLKQTDSAFMINVYPYFAYIQNTAEIGLNYALGNPGAPSSLDPGSGKTYTSLLDAQVDTLISAMERVGFGDVRLIIGESGWPSAGGVAASTDNARMYNNNLVQQILGGRGTPLRPGINFSTYLFALFNENRKTGAAVERNFGLYTPDKTPVYPVTLSV